MAESHAAADAVRRVRRFNRFYTRRLRLLDHAHLGGPLTLTEVRVLYELAHRVGATATGIRDMLQLDAGYLSRLLRGLQRRGLVMAQPGTLDRRSRVLILSARGRRLFRSLDRQATDQVREVLRGLDGQAVGRMVTAMAEIEQVLVDDPAARPRSGVRVVLRGTRPGDLGWIVQRHGELYAQEYQWNGDFERLVAQIVGDFAARAPSVRDRCWIATVDGRRAGCIFLMRDSDQVAKLRLLLVEPWARGHGVGAKLVAACVNAARAAGYQRMTLWTNSILDAARRLYERAGFELVRSEKHRSFGRALVGQTWEVEL